MNKLWYTLHLTVNKSDQYKSNLKRIKFKTIYSNFNTTVTLVKMQ